MAVRQQDFLDLAADLFDGGQKLLDVAAGIDESAFVGLGAPN